MVDIDRSGEELGRNAEDEEREEHCEVIYHVKEDEDEDEGGEKHHKDLRRQSSWPARAMDAARSVYEFIQAHAAVRKYFALALGVLLALPLFFIPLSDEYPQANLMAACAVWMSVWWLLEPVPLAVTALLPLVLFPSLGILPADDTAAAYVNDAIVLFWGGFAVAKTMEKWNLHCRVALSLLLFAGNRPRILLLSFMICTAFLSMWISNTATASLMVPILLSMLDTIKGSIEERASSTREAQPVEMDFSSEVSESRYGTMDASAIPPVSGDGGAPALQRRSRRGLESDMDDVEKGGQDEEGVGDAEDRRRVEMEMEVFRNYSVRILLGVAYSASVGGVMTLIGTAPNLALMQQLQLLFPDAPEISFLNWTLFAIPLGVMIIAFVWIYFAYLADLRWNVFSKKPPSPSMSTLRLDTQIFAVQYQQLGPISSEEILIGLSMVVMILLWFTRLGLSTDWFPGWTVWVPDAGYGTVAMVIAIALFIIPAPSTGAKSALLDWDALLNFPWAIILLLGGGFSMASGFSSSGLSNWIGEALNVFSSFPPVLLILMICGLTTFLTEVTSNVTVSNIFLPIIGTMAVTVGENPLLLMIPCTVASSMAFMFPVATPPNAIVFASGVISVAQMARPGLLFNIAAILMITACMYGFGWAIFGIEMGKVPDWAATR